MEMYNRSNQADRLRIALPSDGAMHAPTLKFLADCGMEILRPNERRYTASINSVMGVEVLFQRAADIPVKVEEGSVAMGVVGYDRFQESRHEDGDSFVVAKDLGFGKCELLVAVPDSWVDVTAMADLADLAIEFRESGRELRIATKYPRLVNHFFHSHGINYFSLSPVTGTLEVAPAMGYADLIVDISATGGTLRENRLKTLGDGVVLVSEGCLIANRRLLENRREALEAAGEVIDRMEAHRNAGGYFRLTANLRGPSEEFVVKQVLMNPELRGLQGPTIAKVYSNDGDDLFALTILVRKANLISTVSHLRKMGAMSISAAENVYLFQNTSSVYQTLVEQL